MNASIGRAAYRCLPMTIANCSGWEIPSPCGFEATWGGEAPRGSLEVRNVEHYPGLEQIVSSHFGDGILTFRTGHLFRTDPGWATWVRGAPNFIIDGIQPLEGMIETDWLPFSFTMNWIFTRPGLVRFNKGDPIAFVTPIPHTMLDDIQPVVASIESDPELLAKFAEWKRQREDFKQSLSRSDPEAYARGWQRNYTQGVMHDGDRAPDTHITKRNLKSPR